VSPDAADGSLRIHQDARLSAALLNGAKTLGYPSPPDAGFICTLRAAARRPTGMS